MSISELLVPNTYDLVANSLTVATGVRSEMFSAYLTANQLLSLVATTPIICNGVLVPSSNYNPLTGQYTVPENGIYKFFVSVGNNFTMTGGGSPFFSINLTRNGTPIRSSSNKALVAAGDYTEDINFELIANLSKGDIIGIESQPPSPNTNIGAGTYQAYNIDTYFSGMAM